MSFKSGDITSRLPCIGPIDRIPADQSVTLGVIVEMTVVVELFDRKLLSAL